MILGRFATVTRNNRNDLFPQVFTKFEFYACCLCNRLTRGIIHRGAEPAGRNNNLSPRHRVVNGFGDPFDIIPDGHGAIDVHSHTA